MQENQVKFSRKKPIKSLTLDNSNFNSIFGTSSNGQFASNFTSMADTNSNEATNNQVINHQVAFDQDDYPSNIISMQSFNFQNNNPTTVDTNGINSLTFPRTPGFLGHQDFGIMVDPDTVHFNTPQWGGIQPNLDLISNERNMLLDYASSNIMMNQIHTANVNDPFASHYLSFEHHSLSNQAHNHNFTNPNDFMTPQFMPTINMNYSPGLQAFDNRFWSLPNSGNLNLINPDNLEQVDFPQLNSRSLDVNDRDSQQTGQKVTEELAKGSSNNDIFKQTLIRTYSHSSHNSAPGDIINERNNGKPTRAVRTRRKRTSKYQASSLSTILSNADLSIDRNDALEANMTNGTKIGSKILDKAVGKNTAVELIATRLRTTSPEIFNDLSEMVAPNNVLATVKTVQTASVALSNKNDGELVLPELFFKKPVSTSTTLSVLNTSKLPLTKEVLQNESNNAETATEDETKNIDSLVSTEDLKPTVSEKVSKSGIGSKKVAITLRKLANRTISPAIFPNQIKDDVAAFQLTSKSNYQLIMEGGNVAAGLNYNPEFEQLVKRKRLHHQASEQKRRAVLASKFKELARILPVSNNVTNNSKGASEKRLKDTNDKDYEMEEDRNSNLAQSKILAGAFDQYNHHEAILKLQEQLLHLLKLKFQLDDVIQLESWEDCKLYEIPDSTTDSLSNRELPTINSADIN